jgi:hypothetical protein
MGRNGEKQLIEPLSFEESLLIEACLKLRIELQMMLR